MQARQIQVNGKSAIVLLQLNVFASCSFVKIGCVQHCVPFQKDFFFFLFILIIWRLCHRRTQMRSADKYGCEFKVMTKKSKKRVALGSCTRVNKQFLIFSQSFVRSFLSFCLFQCTLMQLLRSKKKILTVRNLLAFFSSRFFFSVSAETSWASKTSFCVAIWAQIIRKKNILRNPRLAEKTYFVLAKNDWRERNVIEFKIENDTNLE